MDKKSWHHLFARSLESNKYDYGHVLILGGSEAMVGAPVLAARAALRTGTGLVTVASSDEVVELINRDIEEIMTLPLPPWDEVERVIDMVDTFIKDRHVSVLIIGPGLPAGADDVIRAALSRVKVSMVLDAEVFTALSGHLPVLQSATHANKRIVLTPHPGEYARLTKSEPEHSVNSELAAIKEFAKNYNVTLILKRHHTLVVSAQGGMYENTTGNPGLATAGTGDVLTGILASMLAQKIEPYEAAQMTVYLHGLAGDMATESDTEPGVIASDIIEFLPKALKKLEHLSEHDDRECRIGNCRNA